MWLLDNINLSERVKPSWEARGLIHVDTKSEKWLYNGLLLLGSNSVAEKERNTKREIKLFLGWRNKVVLRLNWKYRITGHQNENVKRNETRVY